VVLASTATLYGLVSVLPVTEAAPPCPLNNYDLHKFFAEKQLVLATEQGLVDGVCLRLANVYGPSLNVSSASDRGVLNKVTAMAVRGQTLKVYGGGDYLRDYVYITDVARAFLAAGVSSAASGRSFNVASGHGTTVRDAFSVVAEQVWKATGKRVQIQDVPWPPGADKTEMRNFIGDISALNSATGWEPAMSLEEGVSRMVDHLMHIVGPSQ
jgi:UDP-glucose 4-epimerase